MLPVDRQILLSLPPLGRPDIFSQIAGDGLPRLQSHVRHGCRDYRGVTKDDQGALSLFVGIARPPERSKRCDLYRKVLAAVIVHEATHLAGGSEAAAREAELQFFGALVAKGLVSREDGLRYLDLLRQRPRQNDD